MLIFQMFPAVLALVAFYALFSRISDYIPPIGLDTHPGLIFAYLGGIALHVWTIKGYFETIDRSLEESAMLDGASPWQAFRLILLPLSVPILAVVFILSFITAITEYPVASILLQEEAKLTLAVGTQYDLTPQEYFMLSRIDGTWNVKAVIQVAPIQEVEALRTLKRMREKGIIELRDPD